MPTRRPSEDSIVIREALPRDAGALAGLAERTFRATFETRNTEEDMDAYCGASFGRARQAAEIADRKIETVVAEDPGGLIGYGQLCWGAAPDCVDATRPAEVRRLYVQERWHGRGVSQRLLSELLARAGTGDADLVWLGVWEHNPRAIAFYEKVGFTSAGAQLFRLGGDAQRDLILVRPEAGSGPKVRLATLAEIDVLRALMEVSIRGLVGAYLDPERVEASFEIMGVDTRLIEDGTYFAVETEGRLVACGGWSRRATLFGGDHSAGRDARLLDPGKEPARIRAMYTHPDFARRGIGGLVLSACETAAAREGFASLELVATVAGEPFYLANGFRIIERIEVPTSKGLTVPCARMEREIE